MNKNTLSIKAFLTGLSVTTVISFAIHFLVIRFIDQGMEPAKLIEMYVALYILSVAHFFGIKWIFQKWPKFAGLLFTAMSLLKMFVALLYLLPDIFPSHDGSIAIALNFMAIYLILLFFEVIFLVKKLMKPLAK